MNDPIALISASNSFLDFSFILNKIDVNKIITIKIATNARVNDIPKVKAIAILATKKASICINYVSFSALISLIF